mgnify:CR=1 FL=1
MVKYKFLWLFLLVSSIVVVIDQTTKWIFIRFEPVAQIGILKFHLIYNTGAGFGILQDKALWLGLVSLAVAIGVGWYYKKLPQQSMVQVLVGLFLGGVVGNMFDRLIRGRVVDFIDFTYWPAFNVADAALTISAIGLVIYFWNEKN